MNLRDALNGAPAPMLHVGKIEAWLETLDEEDLQLAHEVLYTPHPVRADLYRYPAESVSNILARVGVLVSATTVRDHRRKRAADERPS